MVRKVGKRFKVKVTQNQSHVFWSSIPRFVRPASTSQLGPGENEHEPVKRKPVNRQNIYTFKDVVREKSIPTISANLLSVGYIEVNGKLIPAINKFVKH